MNDIRIVVTGSAGFIGSSLANYFYNAGYKIVGLDNMSYGYEDNLEWAKNTDPARYTFYKMDICSSDIESILNKDDIVIHCAGIAPLPVNQEMPMFSINNNVAGTANLLEYCRRKGIKRFILASTGAIYENNNTFPSVESDRVEPTILYSLGKKFCEELCNSFYINYGLTYTVCRFFNVYGPHHDCPRKNPPLIAYIVKSFLDGKQPVLHSNGEQKRDYIFIDDLLDLMYRIVSNLEITKNKTYNFCSEEAISVKDIVSYIQTYMQINIQPIYRNPSLLWEKNEKLWEGEYPFREERLVHEVEKFSLGTYTKAFNDLKWKPATPFTKGMSITLDSMMRLFSNEFKV